MCLMLYCSSASGVLMICSKADFVMFHVNSMDIALKFVALQSAVLSFALNFIA